MRIGPGFAFIEALKYIYAQIVDDSQGKTLVAASTAEKDVRGDLKQAGNIQASKLVGKVIAERAKAKGIETVVFRPRRISLSWPYQGGCRGGPGIGIEILSRAVDSRQSAEMMTGD